MQAGPQALTPSAVGAPMCATPARAPTPLLVLAVKASGNDSVRRFFTSSDGRQHNPSATRTGAVVLPDYPCAPAGQQPLPHVRMASTRTGAVVLPVYPCAPAGQQPLPHVRMASSARRGRIPEGCMPLHRPCCHAYVAMPTRGHSAIPGWMRTPRPAPSPSSTVATKRPRAALAPVQVPLHPSYGTSDSVVVPTLGRPGFTSTVEDE